MPILGNFIWIGDGGGFLKAILQVNVSQRYILGESGLSKILILIGKIIQIKN